MEKNYYKILEIDKNASPEIIKKAYTTLAKKYHPDLQDESVKHIYEEKLKLINEAYEVLSNEEKRKQYDLELARKEPNTEDLLNENINNISNEYQEKLLRQQQLEYQRQVQQAKEKAYYDAYIQDLKNRGYKIRYRKTLKDYLNIFIAFTLTFIILFLVYQVPFVKHYFEDLYKQNSVFRFIINIFITIVNVIINIFRGDN